MAREGMQMLPELVVKKFKSMGARVRVRPAAELRRWRRPERFSIDVVSDRKGEVFEFVLGDEPVEFRVVDVRPGDRHLVLRADLEPGDVQKFLCGHDERHWFVAGVDAGAPNVDRAKESLKPAAVREAQDRCRVKSKDRHRRKNAGFVRQGEWFFVPAPELEPDDWLVLKNEPIRRGRGKPHMVEFLYREGGTTVHVCRQYPNGLTEEEYRKLLIEHPEKKELYWRTMSRDPQAYAKGRVRHPDHKTVVLPSWHRIYTNGEISTGTVAFLD